MSAHPTDFDPETADFLEWLLDRYHHDFRGYAVLALQRRLQAARARFNSENLTDLRARLEGDPERLADLVEQLTVQVTSLYRDPSYFRTLRERVVPVLRTYPWLRIWVAGCSSGEEVYSLAILLREAGLLARSVIYATDINARALQRAEEAVYDARHFAEWVERHRLSGGTSKLSDHFVAGYGRVVVDRAVRARLVFSDHSLATDSVFAETQLVSCRNTLIYFGRPLQERAVGLFRHSLCRKGFLGLGPRESLRFGAHSAAFRELAAGERIFQKQEP